MSLETVSEVLVLVEKPSHHPWLAALMLAVPLWHTAVTGTSCIPDQACASWSSDVSCGILELGSYSFCVSPGPDAQPWFTRLYLVLLYVRLSHQTVSCMRARAFPQ